MLTWYLVLDDAPYHGWTHIQCLSEATNNAHVQTTPQV